MRRLAPTFSLLRHVDFEVRTGKIRHIAIEAVLGRPPIILDSGPLRPLVSGRRVLVTGAGGSIGSELCRHVAALEPERLFMLDRYENSLHALAIELGHRTFVRPVVADITDVTRIRGVFADARPQLVLHAAAHKHVPLMEANPCEAVKNNVFGTRVLAEAAGESGSERFVLISTDKAVNPSSIMGATKRVAELLISGLESRYQTDYVAVRFGNVLGSNGSVLPEFLRQINAGGPVAVTHPEVRRYFMFVAEAAQLVLHAAALGGSRGLCVLDLHAPVRIVDLARRLIRLAGFSEREMPIAFTGLRPGDKMSEDLVGADEVIAPSPIQQIITVRAIQPASAASASAFGTAVEHLESLAFGGADCAVIGKLLEMLPTFRRVEPFAAQA